MTDVPITELLESLGFVGDAGMGARRVLEDAGLTNARKQRLSLGKVERATAELDRRYQRLCHACRPRTAADGREVVEVPPAACPLCGGSRSRRAVDGMTEACRRAGIHRLVVVGGSPNMRQELAELVAGRLQLRLVDGARSTDRRAARCDIDWADLVVVLGATQLAHKVSTLYTRDRAARRKLVTTSRRGIEAIADAIAGRCSARSTRSDRVGTARSRVRAVDLRRAESAR